MVILAGDIGGTKSIVGLFTSDGKKINLIAEQSFLSQQYPNFGSILQEFLKNRKVSPQRACFGAAGPVIKGRCIITNLPWIIEAYQISRQFNIPSVTLLNDLETTAYGILTLANKDYFTLNPCQPSSPGNRAIIAAGTGLGEAFLLWDGSQYKPSASEGGHSDFAPRNSTEIRLLEYLLKRYGRVSYERILSGPGLQNIYQFFKEAGIGEEPLWLSQRLEKEDPSAVISEIALTGTVKLCSQALDLFVSVYGAEAGNLALKTLATGGIYIGGGIAMKILNKLQDGAFMKAFIDKGRFSSLMANIPVRVILNHKTSLLGAALYASSIANP